MAKLNQLQVSVVLKIKQIQNLEHDASAVEKWNKLKEDEINQKLEQYQNKANQDGNDDPNDLQQYRDMLVNEQDWRGYFMPKSLKKSIMFTRTQLLQLINRKRELDEEFESLQSAYDSYNIDKKTKVKEIKEN
jgi:preprotein translocase subunit SecD